MSWAIGTGRPAAKSRLSTRAGSRPRSSPGVTAPPPSGAAWAPLPFPFSLSLPMTSGALSMLPLPSPPLLDLSQVAHALRRLLDRPHRQLERDRPEALRLPGAHDTEPDQLEERQEDDDHLGAVGVGAEQARELAPRAQHEPGQDARHALADREPLARDVVRARRADAHEDVAQRVEQVGQARIAHRRLVLVAGYHRLARAREHVAIEHLPLAERDRDLAEALILDQLLHQLGPRVLLGLFVLARQRQQHAALDVGEGRRHDEVLARAVEVQLGQLLEHRQVLVGDGGDGDVGDLHLVLLDEVEEQVERALEDGEPHGAGRVHRPTALRTCAMVTAATARAVALPASSAARASAGVKDRKSTRLNSITATSRMPSSA